MSERTAADPFYTIPFKGTVADPPARPSRAPKAPPRRTGRRRPALAGAARQQAEEGAPCS